VIQQGKRSVRHEWSLLGLTYLGSFNLPQSTQPAYTGAIALAIHAVTPFTGRIRRHLLKSTQRQYQ
jgi:hypothetical protein